MKMFLFLIFCTATQVLHLTHICVTFVFSSITAYALHFDSTISIIELSHILCSSAHPIYLFLFSYHFLLISQQKLQLCERKCFFFLYIVQPRQVLQLTHICVTFVFSSITADTLHFDSTISIIELPPYSVFFCSSSLSISLQVPLLSDLRAKVTAM